jgi:hypothetical protein
MREEIYIKKIRMWNEPKTEVTVTNEGIGSKIALLDFVKALKLEINMQKLADRLKEEIGSIALTFKADTFSKKVDNAMKNIEKDFEEQIDNAIKKIIEQV